MISLNLLPETLVNALSKVLENVGERIDMEEVNFDEQGDEDTGGVECVQQ